MHLGLYVLFVHSLADLLSGPNEATCTCTPSSGYGGSLIIIQIHVSSLNLPYTTHFLECIHVECITKCRHSYIHCTCMSIYFKVTVGLDIWVLQVCSLALNFDSGTEL